MINDNEATASNGGGLAECDGTLWTNAIYENASGALGGGLYDCDGSIANNTIYGNMASTAGGGLSGCDGEIVNNIVWANTVSGQSSQLHDCSTPSYPCIANWTGGGEGNFSSDPTFVTPGNGSFDYHLDTNSPCIDSGIRIDGMLSDIDKNVIIRFEDDLSVVSAKSMPSRATQWVWRALALSSGFAPRWENSRARRRNSRRPWMFPVAGCCGPCRPCWKTVFCVGPVPGSNSPKASMADPDGVNPFFSKVAVRFLAAFLGPDGAVSQSSIRARMACHPAPVGCFERRHSHVARMRRGSAGR